MLSFAKKPSSWAHSKRVICYPALRVLLVSSSKGNRSNLAKSAGLLHLHNLIFLQWRLSVLVFLGNLLEALFFKGAVPQCLLVTMLCT